MRRFAIAAAVLSLAACTAPETAPPSPPEAAAAATVVQAPTPARKPPQPAIGLTEAAARKWLGDPDEIITVPPATIWRYVREDCEVEVYFYATRNLMKALHYDVRGPGCEGQP